MLGALEDKVDSKNCGQYKQRDGNSKESKIKNTKEKKNVFDGLIRRPDTAERRI